VRSHVRSKRKEQDVEIYRFRKGTPQKEGDRGSQRRMEWATAVRRYVPEKEPVSSIDCSTKRRKVKGKKKRWGGDQVARPNSSRKQKKKKFRDGMRLR